MIALRALDAPTEASQLLGKGKWVDETAVVAALIRKRTGVRNRWVAERLGMGHEGNVTRAIRRVNEYPAWKSKLMSLESMFVSDFHGYSCWVGWGESGVGRIIFKGELGGSSRCFRAGVLERHCHDVPVARFFDGQAQDARLAIFAIQRRPLQRRAGFKP